MQNTFLLFLAALLMAGAGCREPNTQPPTAATTPPASQTETAPQPITASFDTNDYLNEALKDLEAVDSL